MKYYMLDTRQVVGNCALWWAKDRNGYTCNLNEAHVFDEDEAMTQYRSRGTDIPIPVEVADAEAAKIRHVRHGVIYAYRKENGLV